MKRHVQTTGIRNWAGDDLIELQSESLKVVDEFFGHFGPCIISGCEIEDNKIKPGIVGLRGQDHEGEETYKVVPFEGAETEHFPVYLSLAYEVGEREYGDTQIKPIFYQYFASLSTTPPEGEYFTIHETDNHLFVDAIQDPEHRFLTDEQVDKLTGIFHDNGIYTITGTDITLIATDGNIKFMASETVILDSENLEVSVNDNIDIKAQNNINLTAVNGSTRIIANDTVSTQVGDSELSVNEEINLEAEKNIGLHAKDGETNITATETITLSGKDVNVATTNNIEGQANNNLSLKATKNTDFTAGETATIKGKASTVSINDDINLQADKNLTLQAKDGKATLTASDAITVQGKQLDISVNESANITANKDINLKSTTGNTAITAGDTVTVTGSNSSVTVNDNITVEADKNFSLQAKAGKADFSATDAINMDAESFNLAVTDEVNVQADNNITLNAKTGKVQTIAKESISATVGTSTLSVDENIKLEATKDVSVQAKNGKTDISATDAVNIEGKNLNLTTSEEVDVQANKNITLNAETGKVQTTAKESVTTTVENSTISVDENINLEATKDVSVKAKGGKTDISATDAINIEGKNLNMEASEAIEAQANKDITLTAKTGNARIIAQDTASTTVGNSSISVNENIDLEATKNVSVQAKNGKTDISATDAVNIDGDTLNLTANDEADIKANNNITLEAKTGKARIIAKDAASTTVGNSDISVNENITIEADKHLNLKAKNGKATLSANDGVSINSKELELNVEGDIHLKAEKNIGLEVKEGNTDITAAEDVNLKSKNFNLTTNDKVDIEASNNISLNAKNAKVQITAKEEASTTVGNSSVTVNENINLEAEKALSLTSKNGKTDIISSDAINLGSKDLNVTVSNSTDIQANKDITLNAQTGNAKVTANDTVTITGKNSALTLNDNANIQATQNLNLEANNGTTSVVATDKVQLNGKDITITANNNTTIQANNDITIATETGNTQITADDTLLMEGGDSQIIVNEDVTIGANKNLNIGVEETAEINVGETVVVNASQSKLSVNENIDLIADQDINIQATNGEAEIIGNKRTYISGEKSTLDITNDIAIQADNDIYIQGKSEAEVSANDTIRLTVQDSVVRLAENSVELNSDGDIDINANNGEVTITASEFTSIDGGKSNITVNDDIAIKANENINFTTKELYLNGDKFVENIQDSNHRFTTDAERNKLAGIEENANKYIHPSHEAHTSALYKITVDNKGHVIATTEATEVATDGDINDLNNKIDAGISEIKRDYLPLTGGTITNDLTVDGQLFYNGIQLNSSHNINTLLTPGNYYFPSGTNVTGTLPDKHVSSSSSSLIVTQLNNSAVYQIMYNNNEIYTRTVTEAGTMSAWIRHSKESDLSSYLPLSGGTMTGSISLNNKPLIIGTSASNYITGTGTAIEMKSSVSGGIDIISTVGDIDLTTSGGIATYNGEEIATKVVIPEVPANLNALVPAGITLSADRIYRLATGTATYGTFNALITAGIDNTVRRTVEISAFDYEAGTTGRILVREVFNPAGSTSDITTFTFWYKFNDSGRLELFIKNESPTSTLVAGVNVLQYRAFIPEGFVLEPTSLTTDELTNIPIQYIEYLSKTRGGDITGNTTYKGSEIATVDNTGSYTFNIDILALNDLSSSSTREEVRELFNIPDDTSDYVFFNRLYNESVVMGKIFTFQDTNTATNNPGGLIPVSFTRVTHGNPHEIKFHLSFIPFNNLPTIKSASLKRVTFRIYSPNNAALNPETLFEVAVLNHYNNLADYLPLSGGTMSGDISLNENKIRFGTSTAQNISFDATNNAIGINSEISGGIRVRSTVGDIQLITPNSNIATYNGNEIATLKDTSKYFPLTGGTVTGNLTVNGQFKFNSTPISEATWNIDEIITEGDYYAAGRFSTTGTFPSEVSVTAFHLRVIRSASGWITQQLIVLNSTAATTCPRVFSRHIQTNNTIVGEWIELANTDYVNTLIDEVSGTISNIENKLLTKQEQLTAGDNIKIDGNRISATDTIYDDTVLRNRVSNNESEIAKKQEQLIAGEGIKLNGSNISVDITDDLTTPDSKSALSAKQGYILNQKIEEVSESASNILVINIEDIISSDLRTTLDVENLIGMSIKEFIESSPNVFFEDKTADEIIVKIPIQYAWMENILLIEYPSDPIEFITSILLLGFYDINDPAGEVEYITSGYGKYPVDYLSSTNSQRPLSANQGRILNEKFNNYLPLKSNNVEISTQNGTLIYNGKEVATKEDIQTEEYDVSWMSELYANITKTAFRAILEKYNASMDDIVDALDSNKKLFVKECPMNIPTYTGHASPLPVTGVIYKNGNEKWILLSMLLTQAGIIQTIDVQIHTLGVNHLLEAITVSFTNSNLPTMTSNITDARSRITSLESTKQNKLTASNGITINNSTNTISANFINNLTYSTSDNNNALAAYQGYILNQKIENLITLINNITPYYTTIMNCQISTTSTSLIAGYLGSYPSFREAFDNKRPVVHFGITTNGTGYIPLSINIVGQTIYITGYTANGSLRTYTAKYSGIVWTSLS